MNFGAILWLVLCAIAPNAHPMQVRYIAIFSLTTPFAVIVNLVFVFFWLFFSSQKLRAFYSLITLIGCYKLITTVFAFNLNSNDFSKQAADLRVMTWNAHGMGIFNTSVDKDFDKKLVTFIADADADVVCLPEFPIPKTNIETPLAKKIIETGSYRDYRFQADNTLGKYIFLGTAIFSRYPIHNFKAHKLADYIYLIQGDVAIPKFDTLRFYFVHLNTFGLSDYDKAYLEEIGKKDTDLKMDLYKTSTYIGKFNFAFARRAREADAARAIINKSPYPVVVCGDFNDLPGSYTYTTIKGDLKDAFLERGFGIGRTYNQLAPTLRIDHMLYDSEFLNCTGYRSPYTSLSDHNPVIANFEIIGGG